MAGRPTKYDPKFCRVVEKLCILGATDTEIADALGINKDTLYAWEKKYSEFSDSKKRKKILADAEVAQSLFKRAKGFTYKETTWEKIGTREEVLEGSDTKIVKDVFRKRVTTKMIPADVTAQIFWLKNRRGKVNPIEGQAWRDRQELGIEFDQMTDEQLDKVIDKMTQTALNQANNGK